MRRLKSFALTAAGVAALSACGFFPGSDAFADGEQSCSRVTNECVNRLIAPGSSILRKHDGPGISRRQNRDRGTVVDRRVAESRKKFSAALAAYDRRLATYTRCVRTFDPSLNKAGCGNPPTPPTAPEFGSDTFSGRGNQPSITAGNAAAIAVARLQLPTIAPGIGPSPDLNPWNMAAVGYPWWLWADGPSHVSVPS
jgi:hypothetical protein